MMSQDVKVTGNRRRRRRLESKEPVMLQDKYQHLAGHVVKST